MEQKIFKSLGMMAAVMAMCVTLFSCQKEEITIGTSYYPEVSVDKHYLDFKSGEDTKTVKVSSQEEWTYTVDEDWLHVSRDGNGNKLTVQVDENRTKDTRECLLTVFSLSDSKKKAEVKVTQQTSLVTVSCSETELNFSSYEGAYNSLSVQSNGDWRVRSTPDWLRASVSGGNGNKSVSFTTLSANKTSVDRTGKVIIGTTDDEIEIAVKQ